MITSPRAGSEMQAIATKLDMDLPKQPGKMYEGTLKKFEGLHGDRFDQTYGTQMVEDHENIIFALRAAGEVRSIAGAQNIRGQGTADNSGTFEDGS